MTKFYFVWFPGTYFGRHYWWSWTQQPSSGQYTDQTTWPDRRLLSRLCSIYCISFSAQLSKGEKTPWGWYTWRYCWQWTSYARLSILSSFQSAERWSVQHGYNFRLAYANRPIGGHYFVLFLIVNENLSDFKRKNFSLFFYFLTFHRVVIFPNFKI